MLAQLPYLLPLIAGFVAGCSAVFLRRAAEIIGTWLVWISMVASLAAASAFAAGFLWAGQTAAAPDVVSRLQASTAPAAAPLALTAPSVAQAVAGLALALAGGILVGWSLRIRGLGVQRRWESTRFEQRRPYRDIRRPLELGVMAAVLGLCWLRPSPAVWICFGAWVLLWNVVLELGEWELRQRLPACRDYLKRTPRYLPRFSGRRTAGSRIAPEG
jgi:protein-S-isoprenylcysteine O-methyltransferase Ste14